MSGNRETKDPFIQRLGLAVLGPFGLRFVPANHVQVINRLGAYQGARGPFFFWINTFTESLGPRVKVGARSRVFILDHLPTRDLLQLGLQVWLSFSFDPRRI